MMRRGLAVKPGGWATKPVVLASSRRRTPWLGLGFELALLALAQTLALARSPSPNPNLAVHEGGAV